MIIPTNIAGQLKKRPEYFVRGMRKKMPGLIKTSLKKTFDIFFKKFKRKHFQRSAFQRYPEDYAGFGKRKVGARLKIAVKRGEDTAKPLVKTGKLKNAFLNGPYVLKANSKQLSADFVGLPEYAYKTKKTQANKQKALTAVSENEIEFFAKQFDEELQKEVNRIDKPSKQNYGRVIL
jgi:hypothetical protein